MVLEDFVRWLDPRTWPWFLYVWIVFALAGWAKPFWHWLQRRRAQNWPSADGTIESAGVANAKGIVRAFSRHGPSFVAELGYSYSVEGTTYTGFYRREFDTDEEGLEFIRDLKGKHLPARYNPKTPSVSLPLEPSIDSLLPARAPVPGESIASRRLDTIPQSLGRCLGLFTTLSAIGLILSLWVHIGAVMGRRVAPEALFVLLHIGIFVVGLPAFVISRHLVGNTNRKDFWKVILEGSPPWMRYMVYGFFAYAGINFFLFVLIAQPGDIGSNPPAVVWRGFSGHWMAFYSAALAILFSAKRAMGEARRCMSGHVVSPGANFCVRCGQPVMPFR